MGCRTRVFENRHGEKSTIGRGNLSFTTINLPKIAIESAHKAQEKLGKNFELGIGSDRNMTEQYKKAVKRIFMQELEKYMTVASHQLYERFQFQSTAIAKQFPLLMSGMWMGSEKLKPEDRVEDVIKHGTLSIGFIGLAECLIALTGKHHGESEDSQKLGLEIVNEMWELTKEFSEKYNLNFSVIATPAEGLSGRFTKIDRRTYGVIPGVNDREYYTNSNHVPVWYKCTAEHKAKIEAPYHEMCRAGHIFYIELDGDATHNPNTIKAVVDLMDKYNMGYGSINHTRTRCMDCGFENSDAQLVKCPKCGSENIDTIQRITGYLVGTTSRWNSAKLDELKDRVTHTGFEGNAIKGA
jgi:ribonucleoside-triphosphate reductase